VNKKIYKTPFPTNPMLKLAIEKKKTKSMRSGWLHIKQIEKKIRSLIPKQPNIKWWNWKKLNKKKIELLDSERVKLKKNQLKKNLKK
jgi:hypothetical protein